MAVAVCIPESRDAEEETTTSNSFQGEIEFSQVVIHELSTKRGFNSPVGQLYTEFSDFFHLWISVVLIISSHTA